MNQLNRVFVGAMIVAVMATVGSTLLQLHPLIVLAGGLLPLLYYFLRLMLISNSGISQTAVDSIYYFGFIITIASLAASVLSVAFFGIGRDINLLIAQFGVGLLATGLALVFRMVLIAKTESLNQKDISETIDDYLRRMDHVITRVEASAANFDGLSNSLIHRTKQISEFTQSEFQSVMHQSADSFQKEMLRIISSLSEQTTASIKKAATTSDDFFTLVQNLSLSNHVQEITSQVGAISTGLKQFSEEMSNHTRATLAEIHKITQSSSTAALQEFSEALHATFTSATEGFSTTLKELDKINFTNEVQAVKTELQGLTKNLNLYAQQLSATESQVDNLAEQVAAHVTHALQASMLNASVELTTGISNSVKANIEDLSTQVGEQLQVELPAFLQRLSAGIADATLDLKQEIQHIQQDLVKGNLGSSTESIQRIFNDLSKESLTLSDAMQTLGKSLSEQTNTRIEQQIQDAMVRLSSIWSGHLDQFGVSMEQQLGKLTKSITSVENSVDLEEIQSDFNRLSNGIQSAVEGINSMKSALEKFSDQTLRELSLPGGGLINDGGALAGTSVILGNKMNPVAP